jgi:hypothetical protein
MPNDVPFDKFFTNLKLVVMILYDLQHIKKLKHYFLEFSFY